VIRLVTTVSIKHFARYIVNKASQEWVIDITRRSGMKEAQTVKVKPGASVRRAVVCALHHEGSITMATRAC
jgi:hypothetical protein